MTCTNKQVDDVCHGISSMVSMVESNEDLDKVVHCFINSVAMMRIRLFRSNTKADFEAMTGENKDAAGCFTVLSKQQISEEQLLEVARREGVIE